MTEKKLDWGKPFEALLESGAVQDARLLSSDYRQGDITYRVVQVEHGCRSAVYTYHENGTPRYNGDAPLLRNKTRKVTKWYNLYAHRPGMLYMDYEETARKSTCDGKLPLATLPIEIEEPE